MSDRNYKPLKESFSKKSSIHSHQNSKGSSIDKGNSGKIAISPVRINDKKLQSSQEQEIDTSIKTLPMAA